MATEVSNQLDRIEGGKESIVTSIKNKGVEVPDGAKIDKLAQYIDDIKTAVLQSKSVIPFTTEQTVTPDDGFDGLSSVTVGAIPSLYVNTSSANATANDILSGKTAYVKGKKVTGTYEPAEIKTCTVNIKWSITTRYALITATTFANGAISVFTSQTGSGTVTIPNVVCGSVVTVYTGTPTSVYGWSYGKAYSQDVYTHALTIPASTGTYTAEIGVLDD